MVMKKLADVHEGNDKYTDERQGIRKKKREADAFNFTQNSWSETRRRTATELLQLSLYGDEEDELVDDTANDEEADVFKVPPLHLWRSMEYMTKNAEKIWKNDIPERLQMLEEIAGPLPIGEADIKEEGNWIYNQFVRGSSFKIKGITQAENEMQFKEDIRRLLKYMHNEKLDVSFVARYREEKFFSLFKNSLLPEIDIVFQSKSENRRPAMFKVLWAIAKLDRKWLLLRKRKSALQSYFSKRCNEETNRIHDEEVDDVESKYNLNFPPGEVGLGEGPICNTAGPREFVSLFGYSPERCKEESSRIHDEARKTFSQQLFESVTNSLESAESEREVDDVESKFNLHFPPCKVGVGEGPYSIFKTAAGLREVVRHMLLKKMRTYELEDPQETPEDMASRFKRAMFEKPENVLNAARHLAAVEISCEPSVRKWVRSIFFEKALVVITPTSEGRTHNLYDTVTLWTQLDDAQWLQIENAEKEKLLQVTVKLPDIELNKLLADVSEYHLSDGKSKYARLWENESKKILNEAFFEFLLPSIASEARSWLTSRAKNWLLMENGKLLLDTVLRAIIETDHWSYVNATDAPRILSCCWGAGRPSATLVILDTFGEVVDTLEARYLSVRSQNVKNQQQKKNDQTRLTKFMLEHKPQIAVIETTNLYCTRSKEDLYKIISKIVEDNPEELGHSFKIISCGDCLPRIYENSSISSNQLSSHYSGIVRRAVGLGRFIQNPVAMIATLCGSGREITSWKLYHLDDLLTHAEKFEIVEEIMVYTTMLSGLDVNLGIAHKWLLSLLQFVPGLGPIKADFLTRSLSKDGAVYRRSDLMTKHQLGSKVYKNAAGLLLVGPSGLAVKANQSFEPLDDTTTHPEEYKSERLVWDTLRFIAAGQLRDLTDNSVLALGDNRVFNPENLFRVARDVKGWSCKPYKERSQYTVGGETDPDMTGKLHKGKGKFCDSVVRLPWVPPWDDGIDWSDVKSGDGYETKVGASSGADGWESGGSDASWDDDWDADTVWVAAKNGDSNETKGVADSNGGCLGISWDADADWDDDIRWADDIGES